MEQRTILIVDDEKNIRLTMTQALEAPATEVRTAVNGEDALQQLKSNRFSLVFLDLKMPGIDGMLVLRRIRENWPGTRVIIISAHGTINSAVEAMKLGAVDFIQKPFSPGEIRELADKVLQRETIDENSATDYESLIELTKRNITDYNPATARELAIKAIGADPGKPEAYNLLGALLEIGGEIFEAQKFYRAALDVDPTYQPARSNLERATSWNPMGKVCLQPAQGQSKDIQRTGGER